EMKQASTARVQASSEMASGRPIEKGPWMRMLYTRASLCATMAARLNIHARGSRAGFPTLRSMTQAPAAYSRNKLVAMARITADLGFGGLNVPLKIMTQAPRGA